MIFIRYVLLAAAGGASNLASQEATIRLLPALPLIVSVLVGTGVGFVVKYVIDKRWIFFDEFGEHAAEVRKIFVYGLFSVRTTLLFWGIELGSLAPLPDDPGEACRCGGRPLLRQLGQVPAGQTLRVRKGDMMRR